MKIILRFQDGQRTEALLLASGRSRMRVVIPACYDTIEFGLNDNSEWSLPDGRIAEIEAVISDGRATTVALDFHVRHAA